MLSKVSDVVARDKMDSRPIFISGLLKSAMRDNFGALADFDRAIKLDPDVPGYYSERGYMRSELADSDDALADFNMAIDQLRFKSCLTYKGRGQALMNIGRNADAISDFTRAIEMEPRSFDTPYLERGTCYRSSGDLKHAVEDLANAEKYQTVQAFQARRSIAELYGQMGLLDKALSAYDAALKLQPTDLQSLEGRGDILTKQKKYEQALADYTVALKVHADGTGAYYKRAELYRKMGKEDLARADEQKARSIDDYMLGPEKKR